jgi:tetratricopeptide (TPR) repeat protein
VLSLTQNIEVKNKIERRAKVKSKVKILIWAGMIFVIYCFLFYTWGCKKEMDKAKKHYELGVQYHKQAFADQTIKESQKQELADQAIKELQQAIKINPNYAEAHLELGVLYQEKADHEGELRELQQADADYENALRELRQAANLDPNYAETHYRLGGIYHALGGYDQALSEFEEVIRINPNFPRIHTAIGSVYYASGVRALVKATKLDWSYLLADTLKEISYKNKDELKKAIDSYTSATESDTADATIYSKLGQACCTWAQEEYQKAIVADSMDTTAHLWLGMTFLEKGYQNRAMTQYEVLKNLDSRAAGMLLQEIRHKEQSELELKRRGLRK